MLISIYIDISDNDANEPGSGLSQGDEESIVSLYAGAGKYSEIVDYKNLNPKALSPVPD